MGKIFTPQSVASGFNTTNSLNTNFNNIEAAFDKCLSRTGETPNAMEAPLDMNNNDIINVGAIDVESITVAGQEIPSLEDLQNLLDEAESDLDEKVGEAQGYAASASQSASDALIAQGLAEAAQQAAEDAVSSVNLPVISLADIGKAPVVADVSGEAKYVLVPSTHVKTPTTLVFRDINGRAKIETPSDADDIANKGYVDSSNMYQLIDTVNETTPSSWEVPDFFTTYGDNGLYMIELFLRQDTMPDSFKLEYAYSGDTYITSGYHWGISGFLGGTAYNKYEESDSSIQLTPNSSAEDEHSLRLYINSGGGTSAVARTYRYAGSWIGGKYFVEAGLITMENITGFRIYGSTPANTFGGVINIYRARFRE